MILDVSYLTPPRSAVFSIFSFEESNYLSSLFKFRIFLNKFYRLPCFFKVFCSVIVVLELRAGMSCCIIYLMKKSSFYETWLWYKLSSEATLRKICKNTLFLTIHTRHLPRHLFRIVITNEILLLRFYGVRFPFSTDIFRKCS